MQMTEGINQELPLANVQRAIDIHEEIEKDRPLKSVHLGRYLYFKGTILMGLKHFRETVRSFEASKQILERVPEYQQLVDQLNYEIGNLRKKIDDDEDEEGTETQPEQGNQPREKKVKANDESDITTYVIIGTVSALVLGAAFAIIRLRRA